MSSRTKSLLDDVAIAGVGESDLGIVPGLSSRDLFVQAIRRAVADAGLDLSDVDGLYTATANSGAHDTTAGVIAEYLGLRPNITIAVPSGGVQFISMLYQAAAIVAAGLAETFVVASCDSAYSAYSAQRQGGASARFAELGAEDPYEAMVRPPLYAMYALIARRHMFEFGTTEEQLAQVAVQMRENASHHPKAQRRETVTVQDVLNSRMIASPYRVMNCSLISDGGGAVVITSAKRISTGKPVVRILGAGEYHPYLHISQAEDLTQLGIRVAGDKAYAMAGLGPSDIDVACLYDPYSVAPITAVEGLHFCGLGEGGPFIESGEIAPSGSIPVNPHGGLHAYCHPGRPGGLMLLIEAVHQVRHDALGVQIPDADVALVHAHSGIGAGDNVLILGRS